MKIQRDYAVEARRMTKAVELATGLCVRRCSPTNNHYAVKSQTLHADYIIDPDLVQCGCQDFRGDHGVCKHLAAVYLYREMNKPTVKPQAVTIMQALDNLIESAGLGKKLEIAQ